MNAYHRVVVGADGSSTSQVAERVAAQLAHQLGAELIIIHVSTDEVSSENILGEAADRARALGVEARAVRREGDVAESIVAAAAELRADLLVIGDHGMGRASRFNLGSLPSHVAHHSPVDILVVRTADSTRRHDYRSVLIATDGSKTAYQAARHGHVLAKAAGAGVALIYVGDELIGDIVLRDTAARLDQQYDRILTKGNPATQISTAAQGYDLVVVGNKGMVGSRRYIQRVVPSRVAHEAPCDVLIVKTVDRYLFDLRPGEGAVVEVEGDNVAAYLHEDGTTYTLSARCTHMGCIVGWNARARTWDCPCHGSRFDYTGAVINGPATKPLPTVKMAP